MTLVSILGDFHSSILPISYEFKDEIKKHIIIYDDAKSDVRKAQRVIKGQKEFIGSGHAKYELIHMKIDEDSYDNIYEHFEQIVKHTKNPADIYVNTTDGLSSIAIVFSSYFLSIGANIISYDRFANTYNILTSNWMKKYNIKHNMSISDHLLLKGYEVMSVTPRHELNYRKKDVLTLTKDLKRFKQFANLFSEKDADLSSYNDYMQILRKMGKINDESYIKGSVFEEYIYYLIVDNFEFDDVWLGTLIKFEEKISNEFDLLMIKDNHLHTIECKFVNKLDGPHYIEKTRQIREYIDDDGKAMLLSVGADNTIKTAYGPIRTQFTDESRAKAAYNGVAIHQSNILNESEFLAEVKACFFS